ncbi:bacterial regulatory s, tetR family protein [Corynebacterium simulans]|uniref:TetR/AcrR family transcriptional regulator n=1 Tax=Corynebacterium simulans TaxID=146827 RepID=UPI000785D997|nr:TetR/AcrR family transcriptional regulator [Corynebacterium simulans]AMO91122.1 bacterial regulatory s, tetR family protein [Corynebacterium simulans]
MNFSRAKGRPPKALVTRGKIAEAALKIVEESGYAKLTMARIAREVGVAPSALYNHVLNKHELLILVEDAVMAQVDASLLDAALAGEVSVRHALEVWARSYRDVFARHYPLVEVIASTPVSGAPRAVKMYEKLAEVLAFAGVESAQILPRIIMLESFIYGSAFDANAPQEIFEVPEDGDVEAPHLRSARAAWQEKLSGAEIKEQKAANPFAEDPFHTGLAALLADFLPAVPGEQPPSK